MTYVRVPKGQGRRGLHFVADYCPIRALASCLQTPIAPLVPSSPDPQVLLS